MNLKEKIEELYQECKEITQNADWISNEISLEQYSEKIKQIDDLYAQFVLDKKIKVETLVRISYACPAQWEGKTDSNQDVYIRYRGGRLSIYIDDEVLTYIKLKNDKNLTLEEYLKKPNRFNSTEEQRINSWRIEQLSRKLNGGTHSYHGYMTDEEMLEATSKWLDIKTVEDGE
jgi:hypothetical protein